MNTESIKLQRECEELVRREVIYCVSALVDHLIRTADHDSFFEELENYFVRTCPECGEHVPPDAENDEADEGYTCSSCQHRFDLDCEADSEPQEVYEWWIVTGWFAGKLAERGEVIHRDLHGLTVWGRCCTGQAILLDGVIVDIYRSLHRDENAA